VKSFETSRSIKLCYFNFKQEPTAASKSYKLPDGQVINHERAAYIYVYILNQIVFNRMTIIVAIGCVMKLIVRSLGVMTPIMRGYNSLIGLISCTMKDTLQNVNLQARVCFHFHEANTT